MGLALRVEADRRLRMTAPAEWCDACKDEEPVLLEYESQYHVRPRSSLKCRWYIPHVTSAALTCGTSMGPKVAAIAEWELATGRKWPEGAG